MRKISFLLLATVFALGTANLHAQEHKSALTVNAGFSLIGGLFSLPDEGVSNYSIPAIQVGYDYYILNWFSLGAAGSIQFMGVDYDNYEYETGEFVNGDLSIVRTNVAMRALFHYFNRNRLNMYSGVRMGLTNWNIDNNLTDKNYDYDEVLSSTGIVFAPQLVLFGLRGYFTENFGANLEFAVGPPHFFSAGLNYRF